MLNLQNTYIYLQIFVIFIITIIFKYKTILILLVIYLNYTYKNNINFKQFDYSTPESGDIILFYNNYSNILDFKSVNLLNFIPTISDKIFWDMGLLHLFSKTPYYHIGLALGNDIFIDDRIIDTFDILTQTNRTGTGVRKFKDIDNLFKRKVKVLVLKTNFKFNDFEKKSIYNDYKNKKFIGCVKIIMNILKKYNKINKNDKCLYPEELIKYGYKLDLLKQ
jgi:hypothetical protein